MNNIPNPMSQFVGTGFDLQHRDSLGRNNIWFVCNEIESIEHLELYEENDIRPRLNHPTVLDDWGFIKELEGFVWNYNYSLNGFIREFTDESYNVPDRNVLWLSFKGVLASSPYAKWARENDIPVINEVE